MKKFILTKTGEPYAGVDEAFEDVAAQIRPYGTILGIPNPNNLSTAI